MSKPILPVAMSVALALVACADPTPPGPEPYTLTFVGGGLTPDLLVAEDGDGPWQPVPLPTNSTVAFEVTAGYHGWAFACPGPGGRPRALIVNHDAGPPASPIVLCAPLPSLHVTGHASPDATVVHVGDRSSTVTADGAFDVLVRPGTYDVAAAAGAQMVLKRGEAVQADRTIDLVGSTDGFDTLVVPVPVVGAVEPVALGADFYSAGGTYVSMPERPQGVRIVPLERRLPGDRMVALAISSTDGGYARIVQRLVTGNTVPDLPFAPIDPTPTLIANRDSMEWSGTADSIDGALFVAGLFAIHVTASDMWQTARGGAGRFAWPDPTSLPGWDAGWSSFATGETVSWSGSLTTGTIYGDAEGMSRGGSVVW